MIVELSTRFTTAMRFSPFPCVQMTKYIDFGSMDTRGVGDPMFRILANESNWLMKPNLPLRRMGEDEGRSNS